MKGRVTPALPPCACFGNKQKPSDLPASELHTGGGLPISLPPGPPNSAASGAQHTAHSFLTHTLDTILAAAGVHHVRAALVLQPILLPPRCWGVSQDHASASAPGAPHPLALPDSCPGVCPRGWFLTLPLPTLLQQGLRATFPALLPRRTSLRWVQCGPVAARNNCSHSFHVDGAKPHRLQCKKMQDSASGSDEPEHMNRDVRNISCSTIAHLPHKHCGGAIMIPTPQPRNWRFKACHAHMKQCAQGQKSRK